MDKTLHRVTDLDEQDAETYRYWQSLPAGERLAAVWDVTVAAYAFKGIFVDENKTQPRPPRTLSRTQHA